MLNQYHFQGVQIQSCLLETRVSGNSFGSNNGGYIIRCPIVGNGTHTGMLKTTNFCVEHFELSWVQKISKKLKNIWAILLRTTNDKVYLL